MPLRGRRIALIAHDGCKLALIEWARSHRQVLEGQVICATEQTAELLMRELDLPVQKLKSGPQGGDQQIGAKIAEGEIDLVIFLWDPVSANSHDVDVKALLRIAVLYNVPLACNVMTANLITKVLLP